MKKLRIIPESVKMVTKAECAQFVKIIGLELGSIDVPND